MYTGILLGPEDFFTSNARIMLNNSCGVAEVKKNVLFALMLAIYSLKCFTAFGILHVNHILFEMFYSFWYFTC